MWNVQRDAEALAILEGDGLTLLERDGSLRSVPLPGHQIQAVVREKDVVVRFTDEEDSEIYLIRLDRQDLQELDRWDFGPADRRLEPTFTGLLRRFSPQDVLTEDRFFRLAFQPMEETGSRYDWQLEERAPAAMWLNWVDLSSMEPEEWCISVEDVQGQLPGGPEEEMQSFGNVESMTAWGTRVYLLTKVYTDVDDRSVLLEADVESRVCRILWAGDKKRSPQVSADWFSGEPRVLDPERDIQWTFAYLGEGGRTENRDSDFLPLVPRQLAPGGPVLEGEPMWRSFPIAWPEQLVMWNGMVWLASGDFYGWRQDGTFTPAWFPDGGDEDAETESGVYCEGLWQGQLVFSFGDGRLAAVPAGLEFPAPEHIRWLRAAGEGM